MSATSAVLAGRRLAERNMIDTATVRTILGTTVNADGVEVPLYRVDYGPDIAPLFGKCKFQASEVQESTPESGGATYTVMRSRVDFPVGSFRAASGQIVTCASAPLDPFLPGRDFHVLGPQQGKSQATAYRIAVKASE